MVAKNHSLNVENYAKSAVKFFNLKARPKTEPLNIARSHVGQ